jgi:hypothetical protein
LDLLGLGHPPDARLALGELALLGPDQLDAVLDERADVRLRGGVRPHARVHRRRHEDWPAVRERRLAEHVVRVPVRELGEGVRRARRDDEQVGAIEMWIRVVALGTAGEGEEGLASDEPLSSRRRQRHDLVSVLHEEPNQLAGLVGRNPPGDPQKDLRHARILPSIRQRRQPGSAGLLTRRGAQAR